MTCCQLADDDLVTQEAEQFDCGTCEVARRLAEMDDDNREAWALYRACCNRFAVDLQAGAVLLDRLTQGMDADDFAETMDRLRVIYDTLQPPKRP